MKQLKNCQQGFSLTEVMIGIMILTVAIVSATSLLVGLISSNKNNVQTLQAYYLAQEGIEAVRNVRDTNWLYNIDWLNGLQKGNSYAFELQDLRKLGAGAGSVTDLPLSDLAIYSPWRIVPDSENSEIRLTDAVYLSSDSASDNPTTGFIRTVSILSYDCEEADDCDDYAVAQVRVNWRESGNDREVILEEILTNWKGGAI